MSDADQLPLCEIPEDWRRDEEEDADFQVIKVHFASIDDLRDFADLLDLRITPETREILYCADSTADRSN